MCVVKFASQMHDGSQQEIAADFVEIPLRVL